MFFEKTEEIIPYIKANPELYILVAHTPEISDLLIQNMIRDYKGTETKFLSLRTISISPYYTNKMFFKKLLTALINTGRPIMLHDILNDKIYNIGIKLGFTPFTDIKYEHEIRCLVLNQ